MAFFDPLYSILGAAAIGLAGSLLAGSWVGAVACALVLVETLLALKGTKFSLFRVAFGWLERFLDRAEAGESDRRRDFREAAGWAILAALGLALAALLGALASVFQAVRSDPGLAPTLLLLVLIGGASALKSLGAAWSAWSTTRPAGPGFFSGDARQDETPRRHHLRRAAGNSILAALLAVLIAFAYFHCYSGEVHEYCDYVVIPVIVAVLIGAALILRILGSLWGALRGSQY
jgi:hypothetical protein